MSAVDTHPDWTAQSRRLIPREQGAPKPTLSRGCGDENSGSAKGKTPTHVNCYRG